MSFVDATAVQAAITQLPLNDMLKLNKFLVEHIKAKRALEAKRMKRQLFVGTKVSFEDNDGFTVHGKITKVMRKFAQVDTGPVIWRVPINALTKEVA